MKTSKRIITFAAAVAMIAAMNFQPAGTIISEFSQPAGITVKAETVKSFSMPDEYGTWDFDVVLGSKGSNGYYNNAKLTLKKFKPESNSKSNLIIPDYVNYTPKIDGTKFPLKNAKIVKIDEFSMPYCEFTSLYIPSSVIEIAYCAFYYWKNLSKVTFGSNSQLTTIDTEAFNDCIELTSISLPNSLKTIGEEAFANTIKLKSITIPSSVDNMDDSCFKDSGLTNINCDMNSINRFYHFLLNAENLKTVNYENIYEGENYSPKYLNYILNSCNDAYWGESAAFRNYISTYLDDLQRDIVKDCKNDFQKVKAIADWISDKVSYDTEEYHKDENGKEIFGARKESNHSDFSVFFNDKAVCEGYARGLFFLLAAADFKPSLVINDKANHAWVITEINGNAYQIDVTNYDHNIRDIKLLHVLDDTFEEENEDWNYFRFDNHKSFDYVKDLALYLRMTQFDVYDSKEIECTNYLGDGNLDGKVDKTDMQLLSTYLMNRNKRTGIRCLGAFDINGDGKIDQIDLSKMNEYLNNKSADTTLMEDYYMLGK